jgi:deoxyribodipyrimidine photo-lyase
MNNHSLIWLRNDLRIEDNPALYHATKNNFVTAIYLLFPKSWHEQHDADNKIYFWLQNLKLLEHDLHKLNINLLVVNAGHYQDAPKIIVNIALKLKCNSIWFNNEYGYNEQQRDNLTVKECLKHNLDCRRYLSQTLIEPGKIITNQGSCFKVFTPFKKKFYATITESLLQPLPKPTKRKPQKHILKSINYSTIYNYTAIDLNQYWPPGSKIAHKRLTTFINSTINNYDRMRDIPAIAGTSMLSPYLNAGVLSVKQCFYAAFLANKAKLYSGNKGILVWLDELVWREFYKHILVCFPRVSKNKAFKAKTDKIIWENNPKLISAWKQGKTGYPLIDAAMKQLLHTGWMHNRLRMVVAMFLTKNLMVDWRIGEEFFMRHLIDGDLAANNGGWQWAASTGVDAVPYFRIFNPIIQSVKFDPDGIFIRQWIPRLDQANNKQIHFPDATNALHKLNYYKPVVDYKKSKAKIIDVFKKL